MSKDNLGTRMKGYEGASKNYLTRRLPVIIRLDGKAFHTFTKSFQKPFDEVLIKTMQETAKELCNKIQGCKIAYTQSDEISLLLIDYNKLDTCAWFDNNIQKMVSIAASIVTLAFNKAFSKIVIEDLENDRLGKNLSKASEVYIKKFNSALFDARVFSLPKEEVVNYFIWRQQDAIRNSIQMIGQANFSCKELHKKSCNEIQEMLLQEKGLNFNDLPIYQKRGTCIVKKQYQKEDAVRNKWIEDLNIPIFAQNRNYIEKYV